MVLDSILNANIYLALNPHFEMAFNYLKNFDSLKLVEGKHTILDEKIFALISTHNNYSPNTKLEAHKRYIDIQYIHQGTDIIGWRNINDCTKPIFEFDVEKDYILFDDESTLKLKLNSGSFAIFYPNDAHAPLMGNDKLIRIVIKVLVES